LAFGGAFLMVGAGIYLGTQSWRSGTPQQLTTTLTGQPRGVTQAAEPYIAPVVNGGQAFAPQQSATGQKQLPSVPGSKWGPVYPDAQGDKKLDECEGKKGLSVVVNGTLYDCY
jgi:hypothetical protein